MNQAMASEKLNKKIGDFVQGLKDIYQDNLVSVILYGSAASGEFIDAHSDLNILVVLQDAGLDNIKKAAELVNGRAFAMFAPLFFSREYLASSADVFPIEFLDMKENYRLLAGEDPLKDVNIDLKNLRFQCEHELKAKLINLRQFFLKRGSDKAALKDAMFKSANSLVHILRNVIRIKGKTPAYQKQDVVKQATEILPMDAGIWQKILAAKSKQLKLSGSEAEFLFRGLVSDLEKIVAVIDRL